jgi:ribosomal-protein-alanine N-acetyltransferase
MLEKTSFEPVQEIITLVWDQSIQISSPPQVDHNIRPISVNDLETIHAIDTSAFGALWKSSYDTLARAYQQSCESTLIEIGGIAVGYQISTTGPLGGHLARLAVLPAYQGQGIGFTLVQDVLERFSRRGAQRVTVNTQRDNSGSLSLYKKAGFRITNETYPVYQYLWMR